MTANRGPKRAALLLVVACAVSVSAQRGRGAAPTGGTPKAVAPIDLTGN